MKYKLFLPRLTVLLTLQSILAEQKCNISNKELSKMSHILNNVDETIYSVDPSYNTENEECDRLINNIHMLLRRLTQRYKLMNKAYVEAEAQKKMAEDYEEQLRKLMEEFEDLKKKTSAETSAKLTQLEKETAKLEQESSKLQTKLRAVTTEFEKVKKDLCLTFIQSNQMASAKQKVQQMKSNFLLDVVDGALKGCEKGVMSVIDFCSAIPDLDDRTVAYQKIYKFIEENKELGEESHVLLEAAVLKMNATLKGDSNITDEEKSELNKMLDDLSGKTTKVFDKWINDMNKSENLQVIKGALDNLFLNQMKSLGEKVSTIGEYYCVRNFLRLTVVSNNYYKIAAYRELTKKKVLSGLAEIMFDMINMKRSEMEQDLHVPGVIPKLFNDTMELLPKSLKTIYSCYQHLHIINTLEPFKDKCIVVTREKEAVKDPKNGQVLGEFKRAVIGVPGGCTKFRLELTDDRASLRIVSHQGEPLVNMNTVISWDSAMSFVGAGYSNKPGKNLDYSTDWLLEANYDNETIKIKSEFHAYQKEPTVDHMLQGLLNGFHYLFVRRYGSPGLMKSHIRQYVLWTFECAPK